MSGYKCPQCGAAAGERWVCEYCGSLMRHSADPGDQRQALEELHRLVQAADDEKKEALLRNGFLPDHKKALLEAGLRLVPLLDLIGAEDAAAARLRAVILKLKLLPEDAEVRTAVEQFEAKLRERRSESNRFAAAFVLLVLGLLAALVYVLRRFL